MRVERVEFEGHDGSMLAARLDLPDQEPAAYALFAHCFTCGKDIAAARRIAAGLAEAGVGALRFDFTGLGHSEGEFANTTFCSNVADLLRAADWLRRERAAPQLLIGHSLGGAAILAAAPEIPEAKAVATLGAPHEPDHVLRHLGLDLEEIETEGAAEARLAGRAFTLQKAFVEDVSAARLDHALAGLKKALLVLHAPRDEVVGIDNATQIFIRAKHPKSFVSLDDADHLISREEDASYAAAVIAAWAKRYLDLAPRAPAEADAEEGFVRAAEANSEGFLQDLHLGPHHLLADEPTSVGGANLGPSPYQLVAAGLAACTAMTIRMYARRKKMALEHVFVDVRHDKVHATDCEGCEEKPVSIDRFQRELHLRGDLTDAEREKLRQIADKCPVHRTLERSSKVETTLA